jgi:hypothetical protein
MLVNKTQILVLLIFFVIIMKTYMPAMFWFFPFSFFLVGLLFVVGLAVLPSFLPSMCVFVGVTVEACTVPCCRRCGPKGRGEFFYIALAYYAELLL